MNIFSQPSTKSQFIFSELEKEIISGAIKPGERLSSVRKLADHFDTSIAVIQISLNLLEAKDLIYRKHGCGVFIKEKTTTVSEVANDSVLIVVQSEGHFFENFSSELRKEVIVNNLTPITLDYEHMIAEKPNARVVEKFESQLANSPKGVIFNGVEYWRLPFLENKEGIRSVMIMGVSYPRGVPDCAVLPDLEKAMYQATLHLIESGKKKIMLSTFKTSPGVISSENYWLHNSTQIRAGYDRALREKGITNYRKMFERDVCENLESSVKKILSSPECPDAVVSDLDYVALVFQKAAYELGKKCPEDFAVTGCYNTPWCIYGTKQISSINFNSKKLAHEAVRLLNEKDPKEKIVFIEPELIIRESSSINIDE